jgi:hypothetical protein
MFMTLRRSFACAWVPIATVGAHVVSDMDTGSQPSPAYDHSVHAQDSIGTNGPSNDRKRTEILNGI